MKIGLYRESQTQSQTRTCLVSRPRSLPDPVGLINDESDKKLHVNSLFFPVGSRQRVNIAYQGWERESLLDLCLWRAQKISNVNWRRSIKH